MTRRPLWRASAVLAAVWLALPARAADVAAPVEMAPSPVSGVVSAAGAVGGVSLVPTLSPGLNAPLAGPMLAAPPAFPAALAPSAFAGAAPVRAAPDMTAAPAAVLHAAPSIVPESPAPRSAARNESAAPSQRTADAAANGAAAGADRRTLRNDGKTAPPGWFADLKLQWLFDGEKSGRIDLNPAAAKPNGIFAKGLSGGNPSKLKTPEPRLQAPVATGREFANPESLRGATPDEIRALIPKIWVKRAMRTGRGEIFEFPGTRGADIIQLSEGNPGAPDALHQGPYMKIVRKGKTIRVELQGNGNLP